MSVCLYIITILYLTLDFWIINKPRYSAKTTAFIVSSGFLLETFAFVAMNVHGRFFIDGFLFLICYTLPTLILFFVLSEYRDSRFWFLLSSINIFELIIVFISGFFSAMLWDDMTFSVILSVFIMTLVTILVYKNKTVIKNMVFSISKGGVYIACTGILMYAMLFILINCPLYVSLHAEYLFILFLFCIIVAFVYVVIIKLVLGLKADFEEKEKAEKLKAQLKMQQIYYKMAHEDDLTKLLNQRSFCKHIRLLEELKKPVCCISMDLNDFKIINDTFGHIEGNNILVKTAKVLKSCFSEDFSIYRTGGDEFVLMSDVVDFNTVNERINKFRDYISKNEPEVRIAVGYSFITDYDNDSLLELQKRADKNMYANKKYIKSKGE